MSYIGSCGATRDSAFRTIGNRILFCVNSRLLVIISNDRAVGRTW